MKTITSEELFRRYGEVSLERDQLKDQNYLLSQQIDKLKKEILIKEQEENAATSLVSES